MSSFSEFMQPLQSLLDAFDPREVFSSLTNFLGSGYIGIAVASILIWGIVKKVTKVLLYAVIGLIIWYLCTTGKMDVAIAVVQQRIQMLF